MRLFRKRPFHLPNGIGRAGLLILALLAAAAAAGACGDGDGDSDKQAERVSGRFLEVGQNPGTTAEVMVGKLPADLPPGLPEYPGASLIGSAVTADGGQKALSVLRETADPLDNVILFYEDALE